MSFTVDNAGAQPSWVAVSTVDQIVAKYPRLQVSIVGGRMETGF